MRKFKIDGIEFSVGLMSPCNPFAAYGPTEMVWNYWVDGINYASASMGSIRDNPGQLKKEVEMAKKDRINRENTP